MFVQFYVLRLLRANAFVEESFSCSLSAVHGLSLKRVQMLLHVQSSPGGRLSRVDLSKRLHVSPSTVTRMARPLEKLGVIGRDSDKRDARLAYVVLPKSGETLLGNAKTTLGQMSLDFFQDRWSDKDIAQLDALLGRITSSLPGNLS